MASRTWWLAAGLASAALVTLPAGAVAQGTTGSTPSQSYGQSSTENKSPRYHLDQAERVLDELSRSAGVSGPGATGSGSGTTGSGTTGSGATGSGTTGTGTTTGSTAGSMASGSGSLAANVSEIRRHFSELEQAYERPARQTSTTGSASGTTGSGTTGSGTTGSGTTGSGSGTMGESPATGASWMTHYSRLNQLLDRLDVPKTSTATGTSGATSGTGSTMGSGTAGSATTGSGTTSSQSGSGSSTFDAATMSKLREFRMHIDNFHAAAMAEGSRR